MRMYGFSYYTCQRRGTMQEKDVFVSMKRVCLAWECCLLWVGNTHTQCQTSNGNKEGKKDVGFSGANHEILRKEQNYTYHRQSEYKERRRRKHTACHGTTIILLKRGSVAYSKSGGRREVRAACSGSRHARRRSPGGSHGTGDRPHRSCSTSGPGCSRGSCGRSHRKSSRWSGERRRRRSRHGRGEGPGDFPPQ